MNPSERISEDTWIRLQQSQTLDVRFGEETLTDILVLDFIKLAGRRRVKIFQITKHEEARKGADLEIFLRTDRGTCVRYVIQAKKLYPRHQYPHINAKAGKSGLFQIDVLEDYARSVGAVPHYLLFNFVDHIQRTRHWHCRRQFDEKQLGCTLVPSWRVRDAISPPPGRRTFDFLHSDPAALPLRCRLDCDCPRQAQWGRVPDLTGTSAAQWHEDEHPSPEARGRPEVFVPREGPWPDWLWSQDEQIISMNDTMRLLPRPIRETPLPRRLLLIGPDTVTDG